MVGRVNNRLVDLPRHPASKTSAPIDIELVDGDGVSGAIIAATVAFGLSRGIRLEQLCAAAKLDPLELVDPHARLPDQALPQLWQLIQSNDLENVFPIAMATAAPLSVFGGLAEGARFAETLGDAIQLISRNPNVLADRLQVDVQQGEDTVNLVFHHPLSRDSKGLVTAVGLALLCRLLRDVLGVADAIKDVELVLSHSEYYEAYQTYFGVPVQFARSANVVRLHRAALESKIDHGCTELFSFVEEHFRQIQERLRRNRWPKSLHALKQSIITNAEKNIYSATSAAAGANLTLRTAQRLAESEGFLLQQLIDGVRLESAKLLLDDPSLRMDAIAFNVGYSDDRAFRRAFKRMTGLTPTEYRKQGPDTA